MKLEEEEVVLLEAANLSLKQGLQVLSRNRQREQLDLAESVALQDNLHLFDCLLRQHFSPQVVNTHRVKLMLGRDLVEEDNQV